MKAVIPLLVILLVSGFSFSQPLKNLSFENITLASDHSFSLISHVHRVPKMKWAVQYRLMFGIQPKYRKPIR